MVIRISPEPGHSMADIYRIWELARPTCDVG